MAETRPAPHTVTDRATLERWYWTKLELVEMARRLDLPRTGNKPEITERIGHFFDTGTVLRTARVRPPVDGFDWRTATLTPNTVISASYRNTQNVRAFFREHCGPRFRFSNEFMAWIRNHIGAPLKDAVDFWTDLDRRKREGYREAPLPQNQFNAFTRALSKAAPGIRAEDIRRIWAIKRAGPGPHVYQPGDETL
ncbi:MAG: DUF6434 domain-containing protein [Myxococcota bacterium]